MNGRGQSWSMDLIIGVVIFLLAIGVIYAVLTSKAKEDTTPLRLESEAVATKLTTTDAAQNKDILVAQNNQLDINKLNNLTQEDYEKLKKELGVTNDFCIYLLDEKGNLVYLTTSSGNYTGIGPADSKFNISGVPCGKKITP